MPIHPASLQRSVGAQEEPVWVPWLPWADIPPSAAGSIPKTLGRCSCGFAPGSDRAWMTPAVPTQGHQDLPVAAHRPVKVFFPAMLFGVNASHCFPFIISISPFCPSAFPARKKTARRPRTLAVLGITGHHGASESSPISVSSTSPILRRSNLAAREGMYELINNKSLLCTVASA